MFILMYHYVRDLKNSRYPGIKGLDVKQFLKQLEYLESKFTFMSVQDLLEAVYNNKKLPFNSVLLTFDDGYIDHYTNVFPILNDKKIPAFFSMPGKIIRENKLLDVNKIHFILASSKTDKLIAEIFERLDFYRGMEFKIDSNINLFNKLAKDSRFDSKEIIFIKRLLQVELDETLRNLIVDDLFNSNVGIKEESFAKELYMDLSHIKLMKRYGMDWGIHGYDHYWMNRLSEKELNEDIDKALDVFSGLIDTNNWMCCYPYGSYDENVIKIIRSKGAVGGFTTEVNTVDLDLNNLFKLQRFDTNDFPPISNKYKGFI